MHQPPSKLTSVMIRESAIHSAIPIYLREGETKEGMIDKFKGDLVKTIQFLRERHFEDVEVVERKPAPKEKSLKEKVVKEKPVKAKVKPIPPTSTQESLF